MEEKDCLRREIEIRLIRETVYKAVDAFNTKQSLENEIKRNDEHIKLLGDFLKSKGSEWEEFYLISNGRSI